MGINSDDDFFSPAGFKTSRIVRHHNKTHHDRLNAERYCPALKFQIISPFRLTCRWVSADQFLVCGTDIHIVPNFNWGDLIGGFTRVIFCFKVACVIGPSDF